MQAALDMTDFAFIASLMVVCLAVFGVFKPSDTARIARIERKLDAILRHMHVDTADECHGLSDEVRRLADAGKKIEAIALYRKESGAGLAEAKDAVEGYQNRT